MLLRSVYKRSKAFDKTVESYQNEMHSRWTTTSPTEEITHSEWSWKYGATTNQVSCNRSLQLYRRSSVVLDVFCFSLFHCWNVCTCWIPRLPLKIKYKQTSSNVDNLQLAGYEDEGNACSPYIANSDVSRKPFFSRDKNYQENLWFRSFGIWGIFHDLLS